MAAAHLKGRPMFQNFWERYGAVLSGAVGGTTKFFGDINSSLPFGTVLVRACVVAVCSAICALLAKDSYKCIKRRLKNSDKI